MAPIAASRAEGGLIIYHDKFYYTRIEGPYRPLKILAPAETVSFAHIPLCLTINIIITTISSNRKCLSTFLLKLFVLLV